mmetsp:Transcript_16116/g.11632  ORF Transcript_16116/g.11632 Transcript_16116/m.11632 type:complete len:83 (-) Transcript_16116:52-300(-)
MPWQMAPGFIVIGIAFNFVGFALEGIDKLTLGRHRRVRIRDFEYQLDERDRVINYNIWKQKEAEKLSKQATGSNPSPNGHHH